MGMTELYDTCRFLGPMYTIEKIDGAESIYRKINDALEFEVIGLLRHEYRNC